MVQRDDLTAMGTDTDLDWYTSEFEKVFHVKLRGRISEGTGKAEVRILNRIVRIVPNGVRYEANPRHRELLVPS